MSRSVVTSRLAFFRSRMMFRLLGTSSEARNMQNDPESEAVESMAEIAPGVQRDQDGEKEDAVAGSEFVDDLIREHE
jgi:hypothetical protein